MPPRHRPSAWRLTAAQLAVVAAAVAVALGPRPAALVERLYAARAYPLLQSVVTQLSNAAPFALFDVLLVVAVVGGIAVWGGALRRARRTRSGWPLAAAARMSVVAGAAGYLWFVALWGLNYARPPVDLRLGLPAGAASAVEVAALLDRAVRGANDDHAAAHAAGFPGPADVPSDLVDALGRVERADGRPATTAVGRPKPTLLGLYFRMAGVDGLTAPFALETLLNPDLTGPERPFVLAHEWAHLAGYAPEADANFVAWRVTQAAGVAARYSSWLFLVSETAAQVPRDERRGHLERLNAGPRRDLDAIARRASQRVDLVERVGWRVYDGYLRSQGVPDGVRSYSRVIDLIARVERGAPAEGLRRPVPQ